MKLRNLSSVMTTLAFLLTSVDANATTLTYDILPTPLYGGIGAGHFSYDSSITPVGGGNVSGNGLLTDFFFQIGSKIYDESNLSASFMSFVGSGELSYLSVGSDCSLPPFGLLCSLGGDNWALSLSQTGSSFSVVSYYDSRSFASFVPRPVPEPATLSLFGLGVIGIIYIRRRQEANNEALNGV